MATNNRSITPTNQLPDLRAWPYPLHSCFNTTIWESNVKPKLFIGSSREGLEIANAIHSNLSRVAECTCWAYGAFQPSRSIIDELMRNLRDSDFGIFVFSPDDIKIMREKTLHSVRDNVIFELGMFVGRLGIERSFFLTPEDVVDLTLPSDLAGIIPLHYEGSRRDQNFTAATSPACASITQRIRELRSFQDIEQSTPDLPPTSEQDADPSSKDNDFSKLRLEPHKNGFVVRGDTIKHRDRLKAEGASWNKTLDGWVVRASERKKFESLIQELSK